MSSSDVREQFQALYLFAFQVCGDREDAYSFTRRVLEEARDEDIDSKVGLLSRLARLLEDALGRTADQTFRILDNILRSDITRPVDVDHEALHGDIDRVRVMLWELKRTCLVRVLGCLPPSVRLSFVLSEIHGYAPREAAEILGIRESAYRVRLTRARKRVEDYVGPRCQHVDARNTCTCEGRLGIALDADFVAAPPAAACDIPDTDPVTQPCPDVSVLYRRLPPVRLSPDELAALVAMYTGKRRTHPDERAEATC